MKTFSCLLLVMLFPLPVLADGPRFTLKVLLDGKEVRKADVATPGHFELEHGKQFKCAGDTVAETKSLTFNCKRIADKGLGSSGSYVCPSESKARELGGLTVFGEDEMWRIQVLCHS